MTKKNFLIVTLIENNIEELNIHSFHCVFLKYKDFGDLFDIVDIRDYQPEKYVYKVTILDRFAWAALMLWKSLSYKELVKKFKKGKNLVLLTSDLHYWSLFPNLAKFPSDDTIAPHCNDDRYLFDFSHTLGIKHLITHYQCPELENIKRFSEIDTHVIDYHINPDIFKDYKLEKKYDIIVYGATNKIAYPFRYRLKQLLKDSSFNVLIIEPEDNIKEEQLARLINQAWIGLATVSNFSYLVGKYFEISACNTVVLGNMNAQGKKIWSDNYIHINETMTDVEIISHIKNALLNKELLIKISNHMYGVMHNQYTIQEEKYRLYETCEKILAQYQLIPQVKSKFNYLLTFFNQARISLLRSSLIIINDLRMILQIRTRFNKFRQWIKFQRSE